MCIPVLLRFCLAKQLVVLQIMGQYGGVRSDNVQVAGDNKTQIFGVREQCVLETSHLHGRFPPPLPLSFCLALQPLALKSLTQIPWSLPTQ